MHRLTFIHPEPKFHALYKKHLSNYFSVDSAYDGMEALRLIKRTKPNIIVSEYDLPIISGTGILEFVRGNEDFNTIPFIFFSRFSPTVQSLNSGSNDWLVISQSTPEKLISKCYQHLKLNQPLYV